MNYFKRLIVLAMVGAFGVTQAAPVVVTPGSIAKYVYLPKAALAAPAAAGGGGAGAAQLAAARETLTYCINTNRTITVDPAFKGIIQAIVIGGGGGGGSPGGRPSSGGAPGSAGNPGADGTATSMQVNGTTFTAAGGKGGRGGSAGRLYSLGMAAGGDGGDGGVGGLGGYSFGNASGSDVDLSGTPSLVQTPYAGVYGSAFPPVGGRERHWISTTGWMTNSPNAGRYGASSSHVLYTTGGTALANPAIAAGALPMPKYLRCDSTAPSYSTMIGVSPYSYGAGVGGGGGHWPIIGAGHTFGGGGGGGTGAVLTVETKFVSGPINITIGAGGAVGAPPTTDYYISEVGWGSSYATAKPGSPGTVVIRLIPD